MTVVLRTSIVYYRYLFVITGLFIFSLSFLASKIENNKLLIGIGIIIIAFTLISEVKLIEKNYGKNNMTQITYLKERLQKDDIILFVTDGSGFVTSVFCKDNKSYFYDIEHWGVAEAYKAFGPQMETVENLDFLKEYNGRIWIVEGENTKLFDIVKQEYNINFVSSTRIDTDYNNYIYTITLVEK